MAVLLCPCVRGFMCSICFVFVSSSSFLLLMSQGSCASSLKHFPGYVHVPIQVTLQVFLAFRLHVNFRFVKNINIFNKSEIHIQFKCQYNLQCHLGKYIDSE